MAQSPQSDDNLFRILLYRTDSYEVLVETTDNGLRVPAVAIPRHSRVAEQITAETRKRWNLTVCCLFLLPSDTGSQDTAHYQIAEVCQPDSTLPPRMRWCLTGSLSVRQFAEAPDFEAIRDSRTTLDRYREGTLPGFFGSPGWLRVVTDWVAENAAASGLQLTGKFCQFNSSPTFSLLRFETNRAALWFKAVGEPNAHECALTLYLARLLPGLVPRVIASNHEWNAWLSVESEGSHLTSASPLRHWQEAASAFARLQYATIGNALHFIEAGCKDTRASTLLRLVGPFFDFVAQLMEEQAKPTPAALSRKAIQSLARDIEVSLEQLAAGDLPNLLGHLDLNPANILVSETRCVFLDWAEGAVGHPFFSFEYLREHWRKLHRAGLTAEKALVSAYAKEWRSFYSPTAIDTAFERAPLLAAFAHAVVGTSWQSPETFRKCKFALYLRSLTRRMKREADALRERRAVCAA